MDINEEINANFEVPFIKNLGATDLLQGKSIENTGSRFKFGLVHTVTEQVKDAMNFEQDGYHKLFNNQIEAIQPAFSVNVKNSVVKKRNMNFHRIAEGESLSENKLGFGQIRGFEEPQKSIVNEIVNLAEKMDTNKTGAELSGKGEAGKNEIKFLSEVKKSETKSKNVISNETEKEKPEKQEIVNDLKTIVNF